jgi:predicted metallopeptidase
MAYNCYGPHGLIPETLLLLLLLLLLPLLLLIIFVEGIYNYISKTKYVSRLYNVAGILSLQFKVYVTVFSMLNLLYFYLLLLLLLFVMAFRESVYNYVHETNYVSRIYSVAAILWLQFMVYVMVFPLFDVLYFYISNFLSAVLSMAVFCNSSIYRLCRHYRHLLFVSARCAVSVIGHPAVDSAH